MTVDKIRDYESLIFHAQRADMDRADKSSVHSQLQDRGKIDQNLVLNLKINITILINNDGTNIKYKILFHVNTYLLVNRPVF